MEENSVASPCKVVLIGGSAGSLEGVLKALPNISQLLETAIIIVLHRRNSYDSSLTDLLVSRTKLPLKEADEKEQISRGTIYIAPPDYHLLVEKDCTLSLDFSEKVNFSRPSIDVTFQTAAEALKDSVAGILLSGANQDGVEGLIAIKQHGGLTAVQNPSTADVPYMPQQAIDHATIDRILNPEQVAAFISEFDNPRNKVQQR